jgi:serine/tyrosine/threonine adenylyltransferase
MTISGETIDYGPCAFMEAFDPATVFSSIDHAGRYAYGNQPAIAQWNLARLAETLLPLIDEDTERAVAAATQVLESFADRFGAAWRRGMRAKLGLADAQDGDDELVTDLLELMRAERSDFTSFFRTLAATLRGEALVTPAFADWRERWVARSPDAGAMDRVNPLYIARNHLVEEALAAATAGDLEPFHKLVGVVARPFDERPGLEAYAAPAPEEFGGTYRTFCGT